MRWLLLGAVLAVACHARTGAPHQAVVSRPPPPPHAPIPDRTGPSEAECDALFAHAFAILIAERQPQPAAADQDRVRIELRPAFIADCRAGTRAYHACGLAARSRAALEACDGASERGAARPRRAASRSAG